MNTKKLSYILLISGILLLLFMAKLFNGFDYKDLKRLLGFKVSDINTMYYGRIPVEFENIEFRDAGYYITTKVFPKDKRKGVFNLIKKELDKYPKGLLKKNVNKIYIFSELNINGKGYGGTRNIVTDEAYAVHIKALHSEIASLILHNNKEKFPREKWRKINGYNFRYNLNERELVDSSKALYSNEKMLQKGFFKLYSMTNFENDYNGMFELIYYDDSRQKELVSKYEKIAGKVKLVKKFMKNVEFNKK